MMAPEKGRELANLLGLASKAISQDTGHQRVVVLLLTDEGEELIVGAHVPSQLHVRAMLRKALDAVTERGPDVDFVDKTGGAVPS